MEGIGIVGVLILIADAWAIFNIFQSSSEVIWKIIWIALVLFLPLLGLIIWFFAGPRQS